MYVCRLRPQWQPALSSTPAVRGLHQDYSTRKNAFRLQVLNNPGADLVFRKWSNCAKSLATGNVRAKLQFWNCVIISSKSYYNFAYFHTKIKRYMNMTNSDEYFITQMHDWMKLHPLPLLYSIISRWLKLLNHSWPATSMAPKYFSQSNHSNSKTYGFDGTWLYLQCWERSVICTRALQHGPEFWQAPNWPSLFIY